MRFISYNQLGLVLHQLTIYSLPLNKLPYSIAMNVCCLRYLHLRVLVFEHDNPRPLQIHHLFNVLGSRFRTQCTLNDVP